MAARKLSKGPNEKAVDAHIQALRREQSLDTHGEALAAVALTLARNLDSGEPVMMVAAFARELRATLLALVSTEDAGDGDPDAWLVGLPAAVRNPTV